MTDAKYGMRALAEHFRTCRRRYPGDRLLVVFDIDGTLLQEPLDTLSGAHLTQAAVASPRPYPGALETLRWFQMQPDTDIALNTGRPEALRDVTLATMSALGESYKVEFSSDLLAMNPHGDNDVPRAKCEGLRRFRDAGYRIVAMVDDRPENVDAMTHCDATDLRAEGDTLFLLAHRLFAGARRDAQFVGGDGTRVVAGDGFQFGRLMATSDAPRRVRLTYDHLQTRQELLTFFRSSIEWARIAVRLDSEGRPELVGRFPEGPIRLETALAGINTALKSVSFDLRGDADLAKAVLELLAWFGLSTSQIAFAVDGASPDVVPLLRSTVPSACLQRTVGDAVYAGGPSAERWLVTARAEGVTRLSVNWWSGERQQVAGRLLQDGWEVDIHGADDVDSFLRAILLLPTSVTTRLELSHWQ